MKWKKVNRSKSPTVKQMLDMASNLRRRSGKSAQIEINCWHMTHKKDPHLSFFFYIEGIESHTFDSWKETQDKYFELMSDDYA